MTTLDCSEFVLASASPRRAELLRQIGTRFQILPTNVDESHFSTESPSEFVARLAKAKARAGFERQRGCLPVLGADTVVILGGEIFGKPTGEGNAISMLMALSGTTHQVLSAVAMVEGDLEEVAVVETRVTFRNLEKIECRRYWQTGEPADKAGAYGIQGFGAIFVERISGSYSNVVGLPLMETCEILKKFGIGYWNQR